EQVAAARRGQLAEPQGVEDRHGPGAHREDVAEDPTDTGGGALDRLYCRGVVVALHLERHRPALADVHDPGVLAGPLEDARPGRRQAPEQGLRVLVAAVLAPQRAEHAGLGHVRLAAQPLDDQVVLLGREAELGGSVAQRGPGDGSAHAAAASTASRREPSTYRPSS